MKFKKNVQVNDALANQFDGNQKSTGVHVRYEGVKEFWTKREYDYQDLIINGIVVHREIPGQALRTIPFARVDIYYDSPEGIGRKGINGVEFKVYKEAKKFLEPQELHLLNDKWRTAKYEGKYTFHDPMSRIPIYDKDIPNWIKKADLKIIKKKEPKKLEKKIAKAIEESFYVPKEKVKPSPLQDLFLTKDIDPKDVVGDDNLSTLYKHIKGDRELSKVQAQKYGNTLGVAPATLMFEPKAINVWSNVKLSDKIEAPDGSVAILPGECYERIRTEVTVCPSELYRLDIKAIRVNDPDSIYDGFMAYYYETDKVSEAATNKLCMVRTKVKGKTLLGGHYKYYLGIFQIFGTKKMLVNVDPLSENRIIAADIEPDVVAPIVSFTKPYALLADKVLSKNIKQVQQLGQLIRKEKEERKKIKGELAEYYDPKFHKELAIANAKFEAATAAIKAQIEDLNNKIAAQNAEKLKSRLFNIPGLLSNEDDDIIVPNFLKKEDKKRA